jgi:hypothetical protein
MARATCTKPGCSIRFRRATDLALTCPCDRARFNLSARGGPGARLVLVRAGALVAYPGYREESQICQACRHRPKGESRMLNRREAHSIRGRFSATLLGAGVAALLFLLLPVSSSAAIDRIFVGPENFDDIRCQAQPNGNRHCRAFPEVTSRVRSFDGVPVDVDVAFPPAPAQGADGNYPMVGVFPGWGGSKIGFGGSHDRWLSKGFATISMSPRGFGGTCASGALQSADQTGACSQRGYVWIMDMRKEVRDIQYLISLLADEGLVDPTKIASSGASYGGGLSLSLGALKDRVMLEDGTLVPWVSPDGRQMAMAAVIPDASWSMLAYSLVPNGAFLDYAADSPYLGAAGRFGVVKWRWITGLYGLGSGYYPPSSPSNPNFNPEANITTWRNELVRGGPYEGASATPEIRDLADVIYRTFDRYHAPYNLINPSSPPTPMLMANGWNDDLFPGSEPVRFYTRTRELHPDADISMFLYNQNVHARGGGDSAGDGELRSRQDAWVEYYLVGRGSKPPNRVEVKTAPCSGTPEGPFAASTWAEIAPGEVRLTDATTRTVPVASQGAMGGGPFSDVLGGPCGTNAAADNAANNVQSVQYRFDPAPSGGFVMAGAVTVVADISSNSSDQNNQLALRLLDVNTSNNTQTLVARQLFRPVERSGFTRQVIQLHPNAYRFAAGRVPKLQIASNDSQAPGFSLSGLAGAEGGYGRNSPGQEEIQLRNVDIRIPVREQPGSLSGLVQRPAAKFIPAGFGLHRDIKPVVRFTSTPAERTRFTSAGFVYRSNKSGSTFECRLDGGSWQPCGASRNLSGLSEGPHEFQVRAADPSGNLGDPTIFNWVVDSSVPSVEIGGPSGPTASKSATVTFQADRPATFQCRLNGVDLGACQSPVPLVDLPEGSNSFEVLPTSQTGTLGTFERIEWIVDTVPPKAEITSGPSGETEVNSAAFSFLSNEQAVRFECSLDGATFVECQSPVTYQALPLGERAFRVRAIDLAGNVGVPVERAWTVREGSRPKGVVSGLRVTPARTRLKSGKKVRLRVEVTNSGDASFQGSVQISVSSPRKAKAPKSLRISVPPRQTRSFGLSVTTVRRQTGVVRVIARAGGRQAVASLTLRR